MYSLLVAVHSALRWVIIVVLVAAVLYALYGYLRKLSWTSLASNLGAAFLWALRLNLVIGIILWLLLLTQGGFNIFFHIIHPAAMLAAVAVAEVLNARRKRAAADRDRWTAYLLGTLIPAILVIFAIPWER